VAIGLEALAALVFRHFQTTFLLQITHDIVCWKSWKRINIAFLCDHCKAFLIYRPVFHSHDLAKSEPTGPPKTNSHGGNRK
jgi:hypothetical protein